MQQGKWAFKPSENWRELSAKDSIIRKNCALLRANSIDPAMLDLADLRLSREDLIRKFKLKNF